MADYRIVARIVAEDATAPGAESAARRLGQVEARAHRVGASITDLGRKLALLGGAAAGGAGLMGLLRWIVGLHTEVEDATVAISGLLEQFAGFSRPQALEATSDLLKQIKEDAKGGVGSFTDYVRGLQTVATAVGGFATLDQMRVLTRTAIAAGAVMRPGEGARLATMDIQQAFTQGVSMEQTPFASRALRAIGVTEAQFNRMLKKDRREAFDTLLRGFQSFEPMVKALGHTWTAQVDTFKDSVGEIVRVATAPLFERWKDTLLKINRTLEWVTGHIGSMVQFMRRMVVPIWEQLVAHAREYATLVGIAAATSLAPMAAPAAGALAGGAAGALRQAFPSAVKGLAGVGLAFQVGRGPEGSGGILSGLLGVFQAALGPLRAFAGVLGRLAWPLALGATLFEGIRGALAELPALGGVVLQAWKGLMDAFGQLGAAFSDLGGQGSVLNLVGTALVLAFGGLVKVLDWGVRVAATLVRGFGLLFRVFGLGLRGLWALFTGGWDAARKTWGGIGDVVAEEARQVGEIWGLQQARVEAAVQKAEEAAGGKSAEGEKPGKPPVPVQQTNIYNPRFEIKTERLDDPVRVVQVLQEGLERLRRHPLQARRLPVPG